jgi:bifunctional UDP-N-acetylglucosamine pyrophosphorylase/glucosamine-1-phosphate N-acetyltransferase
MIGHVVRAVRGAGAGRLVVVVGHGGDQVRAALSEDVEIAVQLEQLGTAHATACGFAALGDATKQADVVVGYGDCPLLTDVVFRSLVRGRRESGAAIAIAVSSVDDPTGYGRVIADPDGQVKDVVEEAVATPAQRAIRQINAGMYCFDGAWLGANLKRVLPSPSGEYYLTDLIGIATRSDRTVQAVDVPFTLASGVNDRVQLAEADRVIRDRIRRRLMLSGVTLIDPATTYVDDDVQVGSDTVIYPGSILEGSTAVGTACRIGPRAHIVDSSIGDGVTIDCAVVERAVVQDNAHVGPFCHLRPGARLLTGADLGNYAEVKNATIGIGTRMHHFSYIGDADVGDDVNIGAGTITCNYDSETGVKSRSVVETGASLGSDTLLVAPVRVGENALTAAGSVVTRDVEPGVLVVGAPARPVRARRTRPVPPTG